MQTNEKYDRLTVAAVDFASFLDTLNNLNTYAILCSYACLNISTCRSTCEFPGDLHSASTKCRPRPWTCKLRQCGMDRSVQQATRKHLPPAASRNLFDLVEMSCHNISGQLGTLYKIEICYSLRSGDIATGQILVLCWIPVTAAIVTWRFYCTLLVLLAPSWSGMIWGKLIDMSHSA